MQAALGLGAVASYGLISNLTYGAGLAVSWIAFVKQKGCSPLQAGQWPVFLAFYAGPHAHAVTCTISQRCLRCARNTNTGKFLCFPGFWTVQNFVRPLRFALAVSLAPLFDNFLDALPMSRRNAFGVYLLLLGSFTSICVFGSIAMMAGPQAFARGPIAV